MGVRLPDPRRLASDVGRALGGVDGAAGKDEVGRGVRERKAGVVPHDGEAGPASWRPRQRRRCRAAAAPWPHGRRRGRWRERPRRAGRPRGAFGGRRLGGPLPPSTRSCATRPVEGRRPPGRCLGMTRGSGGWRPGAAHGGGGRRAVCATTVTEMRMSRPMRNTVPWSYVSVERQRMGSVQGVGRLE